MRDGILTIADSGYTVTDFTVSASRTVTPDTLTASLSYSTTGATLQGVQQQLNGDMAALVKLAKAGTDYKVATGRYYAGENHQRGAVTPASGEAPTFIAQQTLTLTGTNAQAILNMVANLQSKGMALQGLAYSLSPKQAGSLNDELLTEAVAKANQTANTLATASGLSTIELIRLTPNMPGDGGAGGGMRALSAGLESAGGGYDAPTAEAAEATISVHLSVVYRLS